jgi:hypothetical protein
MWLGNMDIGTEITIHGALLWSLELVYIAHSVASSRQHQHTGLQYF